MKYIATKCAQRNYHVFRQHAIGPRVLDMGAGEGYLAKLLTDDCFDVTLLDVYDANQTDLPNVVYNGRDVPFPDDAFDTTTISLVLHHCYNFERVLQEAIRVTRRRLLVAESVYRTRFEKWTLWTADTLFNGARSGGAMPRTLCFKRVDQWRRIFAEHDLTAIEEIDLSCGIHRHAVFVLDCPCPKTDLEMTSFGSTQVCNKKSVGDVLKSN